MNGINFIKKKDKFFIKLGVIIITIIMLIVMFKSLYNFINICIEDFKVKKELKSEENIKKLKDIDITNNDKKSLERYLKKIEEVSLKYDTEILSYLNKIIESIGKEIDIIQITIEDTEINFIGKTKKYEDIFKLEETLAEKFNEKYIDIMNIENNGDYFSFIIFIGDSKWKED